MNIRTLLVPASLALVLISCAPKRSEVSLDTALTTHAMLLDLVERNASRLTSLTGAGVVTFDSPEMSGSAAFESNMKKPDSLLVTLEGPFGIDLGTLFLSRDTFLLYNNMEHSVVTGDPRGRSIRSVIPFDLTSEQILNLFAGLFAAPAPGSSVDDYRVDQGKFVLTTACGDGTCTYTIDPQYLLVEQYEMRSHDGALVVDARASSFTEDEGVAVARRVMIRFPQQRRQVSLYFNSINVNASNPRFAFSIPPGARRVVQ